MEVKVHRSNAVLNDEPFRCRALGFEYELKHQDCQIDHCQHEERPLNFQSFAPKQTFQENPLRRGDGSIASAYNL